MNRDTGVMVRAAPPTLAAPVIALALLFGSGPARGEPPPPSPARTEPPECQPTQVTFPPDATGPVPAAVTVRFEVGDDGRARDVSVGFPVDAVVSDLLVQAAVDSVQGCKWIAPGEGRAAPGWPRVVLRLPVVLATATEKGLIPPRMIEAGCFRESFRLNGLAPAKELAVVAKFPVYEDGRTGAARLLQRFDDAAIQDSLEGTITAAVKACAWKPGTDAAGRPMAMYVVMPIRLR